jgi:hypothetical protein
MRVGHDEGGRDSEHQHGDDESTDDFQGEFHQ